MAWRKEDVKRARDWSLCWQAGQGAVDEDVSSLFEWNPALFVLAAIICKLFYLICNDVAVGLGEWQ